MWRMRWTLILGSTLGLLLACAGNDDGDDSVGEGCPWGSQGCPCDTFETCDAGLICDEDANMCVADPNATGTDTTTGDGDTTGDTTTTTTTTTTGDGDTTTTTTGSGEDCVPLANDCPVVGQGCTWDGQDFVCVPGMIALGDSCDPDTPACIAGFCAPQADVPGCPSLYCCAGFCKLDMPFCTEDGAVCTDYFPPGATEPNIGACVNG